MKATSAILTFLVAISASGTTKVEARPYGSVLVPRRRFQYSRSPMGDPFGLLSEMFTMPVYMNSLMKQQQRELERLTQSASPSYSVTEDEDMGAVQLMMELPGVLAKDLNVEVVDGSVLRISGSRKYIRNGSIYDSEFDQSFEMQSVDPERLKVTLSSGILTIRAPKKEKTALRIPISTEEGEHQQELLEVQTTQAHQQENSPVETEVDGLTITEEE